MNTNDNSEHKPIKDFRDFAAALDDPSEMLPWINEAFEKAEPIVSDASVSQGQYESTKKNSEQKQQDKIDSRSKKGASPVLVLLSEVEEKPIQWLWENKIPLGMLSLIAGLAGVGKSFWTIFITAIVTNGSNWPDGKLCEKGSVIFFYGEEGIADTYKLRCRANGVNQDNVVFITGIERVDEKGDRTEIDITLMDVAIIEKAIKDTVEKTGLPVKMIVIDPVSNYWGGAKENSNAEVRSVLKPLQHLAERTGVAFVLIQHVGKSDHEHAQQQVLGSTGIVASCRSVWGIFADTEDKDKRIFTPMKVNCGFNHTSVSYEINPPDGVVKITNSSIENLTADDIVQSQRQSKKAGRPPKERTGCMACIVYKF